MPCEELGSLSTATCSSQARQQAEQRTYINPIDLDYRYNFEQINEGVSYRTGADPAVVNYHGHLLPLPDAGRRLLALDRPHRLDVRHAEPLAVRGIVAPAAWSTATPDPDAVHVVHGARLDPCHDRARKRQARFPRAAECPSFPARSTNRRSR